MIISLCVVYVKRFVGDAVPAGHSLDVPISDANSCVSGSMPCLQSSFFFRFRELRSHRLARSTIRIDQWQMHTHKSTLLLDDSNEAGPWTLAIIATTIYIDGTHGEVQILRPLPLNLGLQHFIRHGEGWRGGVGVTCGRTQLNTAAANCNLPLYHSIAGTTFYIGCCPNIGLGATIDPPCSYGVAACATDVETQHRISLLRFTYTPHMRVPWPLTSGPRLAVA